MKWLKDNLILVIVVSLLIIGLIWEVASSHFTQPSIEATPLETSTHEISIDPFESASENDQNPNNNKLYVDIKGEIDQPGVYLVDADDRVIDVIESAGGFTMEADENQINLAEKVYDEMVIIVPNRSEDVDLNVQSDPKQDKININTASQQELEELPGIGATRALAIIQYREENGPFKMAEELQNISGIGEKTFEKLIDHVIVP